MDVDRPERDDVIVEEVDGYEPEEAAGATEEWSERVPPGDEPVEPGADTDDCS